MQVLTAQVRKEVVSIFIVRFAWVALIAAAPCSTTLYEYVELVVVQMVLLTKAGLAEASPKMISGLALSHIYPFWRQLDQRGQETVYYLPIIFSTTNEHCSLLKSTGGYSKCLLDLVQFYCVLFKW